MSGAPLGFFDSGVGGLSVLREARALLPAEELLYVADSANAPWGDKSEDFIRERSLTIGGFLVEQSVKALVFACNTGTAVAVEALRSRFALPVVAVEPGVKPAAAITRSGVVAALVTSTMNRSERMASLLDRFGKQVRVITQPCPGLVECVEAGDLEGPEVRRLAEGYLQPLLAEGVDAIALGCTHYPFLLPLFEEIAGEGVTFIDTGAAVARQLQRILTERDELNASGEPGGERYWTSADPERAQPVIARLLDRPVPVQRLPEPAQTLPE